MRHTMRLYPIPFNLIKQEAKTIELRLYDEKRKTISVGDEIEFINTENAEASLICRVIALHRFSSFKELYNALPLLKCGYTEEDIATASFSDMEAYYSREMQEKYGVIGIELKLL